MGRAWQGRAVARGWVTSGGVEKCEVYRFESRANCPGCTKAFTLLNN